MAIRLRDCADDATSPVAGVPGQGKRKALKAFLHKLRHPAVPASAEAQPASAPAPTPALTPAQPTLGSAADRAAAHTFARSLSSKSALTVSPNRLALPSMPETPFAQMASGSSPDTPQQGVPPSMRVRALSRKFAEVTQQPLSNRYSNCSIQGLHQNMYVIT